MASITSRDHNDTTDEEGGGNYSSHDGVFSDPEVVVQPKRAVSRQSRHSHRSTASHVPTLEPAIESELEGLDITGSHLRFSTESPSIHSGATHAASTSRRKSARVGRSHLVPQTPLTSPVPESAFIPASDSYHGPISGKEAVRRLKKAIGNVYLTRFSPNHSRYILTVLKRDPSLVIGNFQLDINTNNDRFSVHGMDKRFSTLDGLLRHYQIHRIHPVFDTIGRKLTVQEYTTIANKWSCTIQ